MLRGCRFRFPGSSLQFAELATTLDSTEEFCLVAALWGQLGVS